MLKLKLTLGTILFLIMWGALLFVFYTLTKDLYNSIIYATISVIIVGIGIALKLKQMDREKDGWYFSGVQDNRLKREEVLALLREFLRSKGYEFVEEETHRTMTLWITYFTISSADFKLRLWFTKLGGVPVAEIGIGPETPANKDLLK